MLYIRDLLYELVLRDFKLRYKRSVLGIGWSLLNPLAQLLVYLLVFSALLPRSVENFAGFLFLGILGWDWFTSSLIAATNSIVGNRDLIKRPGFPSPILPLIAVTSNFINFVVALPILAIVLFIEGTPFMMIMAVFPLIILLQFVLSLGLGYLLATFHVTFRDTDYLLRIVLKLAFFITGVFYDPVPLIEKYPFLTFNPMVHILAAYRSVMLEGKLPPFWPTLIISSISLLLLILGYVAFKQTSYRYVEEL